jgi:serine/threonine protein kinase
MAAVAASGSHLTGDELTTLGEGLGARGLKTPGSNNPGSNPGSNDARLTPGQTFGPYLIGRLLGRGGMGEVYEAEHQAHGRRVALKVLNRRLAGPEDRARFLREGQLAASVTHPNTVYIFGSEEIEGTPVISMELVAGGTLKDRVAAAGPLTPAQAVDAVLDLAAGLDAARAGGVLHRDIKPSNCFVESDGRVKIGDFGLSISTIARDVTQHGQHGHAAQPRGGFEGTPQYAAPEQLKGQSLDARADIYAVGATLYYLLTGQPPFDDRDLPTLVARVTEEPAAFPRQGRRTIPSGLAAVVLRCLAKERADRPATYAELEDLLRPFSSTAPTPANPGLRLIAGAIDKLLLTLLTAPLTIVPKLEFQQPASVNFGVNYADAAAADASLFAKIAYCGLMLFYYTLLEGLTGASLGKRLCNLQVTARGQHPGIARAFVRTMIFMLPVWWAYLGLDLWPIGNVDSVKPSGWLVAAMFLTTGVLEALIFTSMRRRNGYAGWHDLATGTRVISRRRDQSRTAVNVATDPTASVPANPIRRLGPFEVTHSLGSTASGELFAGFDPVLAANGLAACAAARRAAAGACVARSLEARPPAMARRPPFGRRGVGCLRSA